jgi:hypothetical protein
MQWLAANPVTWILPALLVLAWIAILLLRRSVWPWFFVAAAALILLCFPAGVLAGHAELDGVSCTPDNLCFSLYKLLWWLNGMLGFLTTGALALLTLAVDLVHPAVRRGSGDRAAEQRP